MLAGAPAVVLVALTYVVVLHYAYATMIAPQFTYLRYGYRSPDPIGYGIAIACVVGLALVLPRRISRPSHFIAWVLFIVLVAPSLVVPQYATVLSSADALQLAAWITVGFVPIAALGTRQGLRDFLPRAPLRSTVFWLLFVGVWAVLNAYILITVGVKGNLPSLDDVYGVRLELRAEQLGDPVLAYTVPLLANFINPALMVRGLWFKRWLWFGIGVLGQLYIYDVSGNKTAVLSPIALAAAYLLLRMRRPPGALPLLAAPLVAVTMMVIDWLTASSDWTSLMVRRFLVTPGLLSAGYVSVFADIDKARLAHSIFSPFLQYPYQKEPPDLVGAEFFDRPLTHANASFLADGYANFGYPGMLGACLIVVLLLWAVDDAARGLPIGFSCLLFLMPALALVESGVLTTMLTHGFVFAIVTCILAPRTGWPVRRKSELASTDQPRTAEPAPSLT